jgi:hypothetical protein
LFAKVALAEYASTPEQSFLPFERFHDVTPALRLLIGDLSAKAGKTRPCEPIRDSYM